MVAPLTFRTHVWWISPICCSFVSRWFMPVFLPWAPRNFIPACFIIVFLLLNYVSSFLLLNYISSLYFFISTMCHHFFISTIFHHCISSSQLCISSKWVPVLQFHLIAILWTLSLMSNSSNSSLRLICKFTFPWHTTFLPTVFQVTSAWTIAISDCYYWTLSLMSLRLISS